MTRRDWMKTAAAAGVRPLRAAARRPNIVLFLADDLGYGDLSSYGCPDIRTPNIDSLGRQGVRFTRFYANAPECTPTRTALLTGRYQHRVGGLECAIGVNDVGRYDEAEWLAQRGELGLPATETSLARMLKNQGYATGCFGKWHLGYREKFWPIRHGFDESFGILGGNADYFKHTEENGRRVLYHNTRLTERKGYLTDLFAEAALDWLKRQTGGPFFCYVPFTCPHTPIQDPDAYDPTTGTAPVRQGDRRIFAKMVERMDARIGDLLGQLDRMGVAENTLVLFLSDNGGDPNGRNAPWRGRKGTLWEGGIRVPCLARWPGTLPAGKVTEQVGATIDLAPTLLAAGHLRSPRPLDGVSLLDVLTGKKEPFARTLFWRYKRGEARRKAVRVGDLKYVIDDGKEELHDLSTDELEQKNLLPQAADLAAPLKSKLEAWEKEVAAPRLRGFKPQSRPGGTEE